MPEANVHTTPASSVHNNNNNNNNSSSGPVQRSAHGSSMESSIFRFKNINFITGKGDKEKHILRDVSGTVKWGHVLAVMGPSGAGKRVDARCLYGKPYGSVTLNGVPLTNRIFKEHCYVVVQQDKHFPYLTCRETLRFAAELYDVATKDDLDTVVDEIVDKMGLRICADTRNARLSGGQARRLSIGIALLKQPTLLFLDEPTSGLDAAAAENIMQEIVRVAKDERIIIMCTIHQPSTKVYNGFDETMILSRARTAFAGTVEEAAPYFERIGYPLPALTNPAEHFLDLGKYTSYSINMRNINRTANQRYGLLELLVNADFSDDTEVDKILDTWEEMKPDAGSSHHKGFSNPEAEGQSGVTQLKRAPIHKEIPIMFRRHVKLIVRDPILYAGRAVVFLIANTIFALVYLKARKYNQDQAFNKMWINIWHVGVASNMGVVAVYALNDEFKSIVREAKNGMTAPMTYVVAKSLLVLPIIFVFAIFALGMPSILIMDFPGNAFGKAILLWSAVFYVFECVAECFSVWIEDPILGMLAFTSYWFSVFLFSGFLISVDDLVYPFKIFYYIMPFSYYIRSQMYNFLIDTTWAPCDPNDNVLNSPICEPYPTGQKILEGISLSYPVIEAKDTYRQDVGTMVAIAVFFKALYIVGVYVKTSRTSKFYPNTDYKAAAHVTTASAAQGNTKGAPEGLEPTQAAEPLELQQVEL